jgi:hypothetical protein
MGKKIRSTQVKTVEKKLNRNLIYIPLIILLIKFFTIPNIITGVADIWSGAWPGADGEHYLTGTTGIVVDGIYSDSDKLTFWPAGYPLLMSIFAKITLNNFLIIVSIIQSTFFACSTYFFTKSVSKTKLVFLAVPLSFFISINPPLSLSSLAIGYESLIASAFLISAGLIIDRIDETNRRSVLLLGALVGLLMFLVVFIQPRYLLVAIFFSLFILFLSKAQIKVKSLGIIVLLAITSLAPAALIYRNHVAVGKNIISSNLGSTMKIGAGDKATGAYTETNNSLKCESKDKVAAPTDGELIQCVVNWYLKNPIKTAKLVINKSQFFWSPWSGPLANGTMARNPWLKIDPVMNIAKNQEGRKLVTGPFGKLVSWAWLLGGLGLFFAGLIWLHRTGGQLCKLAWLSFTPILISWLVSIGTIGDHRFRLPTMGLSLFLQVAGYFALKNRFKTDKLAPTFEQPARSR